jgi:hypothetical protein
MNDVLILILICKGSAGQATQVDGISEILLHWWAP